MRRVFLGLRVSLVCLAVLLLGLTSVAQYDADYGFAVVDFDQVLGDWGAEHGQVEAMPRGFSHLDSRLEFELTEAQVSRPFGFAPVLQAFFGEQMQRYEVKLNLARQRSSTRRVGLDITGERSRLSFRGLASRVHCEGPAAGASHCYMVRPVARGSNPRLLLPHKSQGRINIYESVHGVRVEASLLGLMRHAEGEDIRLPAGTLGQHAATNLSDLLQRWLVYPPEK